MISFIDVSGDFTDPPKTTSYIVAAMACIKKNAISDITQRFYRLKEEYLQNVNKEIKSSEYVNKSTLTNPQIGKFQFIDRFFSDCIGDLNCKYAAIVMHNPSRQIKSSPEILPPYYKDLLWRAESIARYWRVNDTLVVIDNNRRKQDKNIAFAFNNYLYRSVSGQHEIHNILPAPIFGDSETTMGLQMADIVAGTIRKCCNEGIRLDENVENESPYKQKLRQFLQIIQNRASKNAPINGRSVWPIYYAPKTYLD